MVEAESEPDPVTVPQHLPATQVQTPDLSGQGQRNISKKGDPFLSDWEVSEINQGP